MTNNIKDKALYIEVEGGLTANVVSEYKMKINELIPESDEYMEVNVDLNLTDNIDSVGVTFVISMYKRVKSLGKIFKVIGANDDVISLFKLMKLDQFFEIQKS